MLSCEIEIEISITYEAQIFFRIAIFLQVGLHPGFPFPNTPQINNYSNYL